MLLTKILRHIWRGKHSCKIKKDEFPNVQGIGKQI